MEIKKILKLNHINKVDFAKKLHISRPTLDIYIKQFEQCGYISNSFYDNLFHKLFDGDKTEEEIKSLIDNIPSQKTKVVVFKEKMSKHVDYYFFKETINNIRLQLDNLEKELDSIYKGD